MRIRDRQDKLERLLSFYKFSKGSPFQEASTHVKGKVDFLGALLFMDGVDEQKFEAFQRSGIRTGIDTRLVFETHLRDRDTLAAEFVAGDKDKGGMFGGPLSLAKLMYTAHISNFLSAVASPMGARCKDVAVATNSHQHDALTEYSEFGPPLLNQNIGSGIGVMVRKLNMVATLAQFVSSLGLAQFHSPEATRFSTTFGQVVLQLSRNTKLSLLGMRRDSLLVSQTFNLGPFTFPVSILKHSRFSATTDEEESPRSSGRFMIDGSVALMIDSDLDESTRLGGWIEMKNSNPGYSQWAVTMRDTPEDEFGWGLTVGGSLQGPKSLEHFQFETFLNLNFGTRFKFQPAIVYVKDGAIQFPAIMLRSSWSL
ncbi:uncharacterized protein LOC127257329 isoform X2 [Andrographis paniculata]|nr:uncharacterized protein LOC127257329 isoform X2 [Andrographis paniculata]